MVSNRLSNSTSLPVPPLHFGGGYADGEGPEKLTMAAKLKHVLSIASEEDKDEENAKAGGESDK